MLEVHSSKKLVHDTIRSCAFFNLLHHCNLNIKLYNKKILKIKTYLKTNPTKTHENKTFEPFFHYSSNKRCHLPGTNLSLTYASSNLRVRHTRLLDINIPDSGSATLEKYSLRQTTLRQATHPVKDTKG